MMTPLPALIRRNSTDRIANYLKRRPQVAVDRGLRGPSPTSDEMPNVGMFGTPGSLPTNPGPADFPIEPDALPGSNLPSHTFVSGSLGSGAGAGVGAAGNIAGGFNWPAMPGWFPTGPVTGYGYNPPSGNAPPTVVPTYWGPSGGGSQNYTGAGQQSGGHPGFSGIGGSYNYGIGGVGFGGVGNNSAGINIGTPLTPPPQLSHVKVYKAT